MTDTTTRQNTREREADEQDTEASEELVCPECGGRLVSDAEHGETVCKECGLVVEEDEI
ncbi:MAG: transcription initiation factor IIB 2, partial [Halobacteriales archaeon SW_9_67_25]